MISDMIRQKTAELNIKINSKKKCFQRAFELACKDGYKGIAEMYMQKPAALKINLNSQDQFGMTAFQVKITAQLFIWPVFNAA